MCENKAFISYACKHKLGASLVRATPINQIVSVTNTTIAMHNPTRKPIHTGSTNVSREPPIPEEYKEYIRDNLH